MDTNVTKPVERFFTAFGQGDLEALIETLHEDIVIDNEGPDVVPVYRTYRGKAEARRFIETLGQNFQTQQFDIQALMGQGDTVMAAGVFKHIIVPTGKTFASSWALRCKIKDDKIVHYRFYEDTAAAVEAFRNN